MPSFLYERPKTRSALIGRLAEADGKARLLAGGTDLLAQLRSRLVRPQLVLDLKGIEELHHLQASAEGLSIGAAVILNRLLEQPELTGSYRALTQAVSDLASYNIRNRATLVGNVTNASPCADSVPPLCVMDGRVEIDGPAGARQELVKDFITGVREVRLAKGELVTRLIVPPLSPATWTGFAKRKRVRGHDLALCNAALLRDPETKRLRLSIGSCNPRPVLLDLDAMFAKPDLGEAVRRAQEQIQPIDDVRASREYRREMVAVMVRRLFADLAAAS